METFGPYQLLDLLGRGGMGEVFRAHDTVRDRVVALKRLIPDLADDPAFAARFRRESALVAKLNEPHIIPIHDYGTIDGRLHLDMRLVEGDDLGDVLRRDGPLTPERAVDVIAQLASALDAAHVDGLVHRDVKPSNALLTGGGFVYLVDFGIARSITGDTSLTATGSTVGTLHYMAPERFDGRPIDGRVDVGSAPISDALSADDTTLYVSWYELVQTGAGKLLVIDPVAGTVTLEIRVGDYARDVTVAGSRVLVAARNGLSVVDPATGTSRFVTGVVPLGVAAPSDGTRAYAPVDGGLAVIDPAGCWSAPPPASRCWTSALPEQVTHEEDRLPSPRSSCR